MCTFPRDNGNYDHHQSIVCSVGVSVAVWPPRRVFIIKSSVVVLLSFTTRPNLGEIKIRLSPDARVDVCREGHENEQSAKLDARRPQGRVVLPLFHKVWDLEQANQPHKARKAQRANQLGGPVIGNNHENQSVFCFDIENKRNTSCILEPILTDYDSAR